MPANRREGNRKLSGSPFATRDNRERDMNAFRTVFFSVALVAATGCGAFAQNSGGAQSGGGMGDYMSKHSGSDSRSKDPGTTGTTTTKRDGDASNNKASGKTCTQKGGNKAQGNGEKC
jgi:hypothetical protein